jgi:hypothetical protein
LTENSPAVQIKSKQRVSDHGEVFTPAWMVQDMLDLVKNESERIDSRFLEPACGSGNFLIQVLARKLATVQSKYGKSEFEKRHHALLALMCIYGIELLEDNTEECRSNLLRIFQTSLKLDSNDELFLAARNVLKINIIRGDALSMLDIQGEPLVFPEWSYLSKGKFSRRDFKFDDLTHRSSFEGTLFDDLEMHQIFEPLKDFPQMTISDLSVLAD